VSGIAADRTDKGPPGPHSRNDYAWNGSRPPGETDTGRLEVGETRDGSPVRLPVAVINGAEDGETLYLQAVSDGDELNGLGVVNRVVPRLDPAELSGTVLVVGVVNYFAFQVAEHRNPIDDRKMNRGYPGNEGGTTSERIAHATFQAAKQADLILDLHQGSTSRMINETRVRCGVRHHLHGDCLELAKAFGCGHVLDIKGPDGQLARAARNTVSRPSTPNSAAASDGTRSRSGTGSRACSTCSAITASSTATSSSNDRSGRAASISTGRQPAGWSGSSENSASASRPATSSTR